MGADRLTSFARPDPARTAPLGADGSWLASRPRPVLLGGVAAAGALTLGWLAPTHPLYAVGLLVAAALVAAVLLRPLLGAFLLVGLVPVTSGLATGFPIAHLRVSEALIGVVGVTLVVFVRRRDTVPWQALDWILLAYGLCWMVCGIVADRSLHQDIGISDWGTVFGQLQFFLVYRGVRIAVRTDAERRAAIGVLLVSSVSVSLLAVLQEIRAPGIGSFIDRITGGITSGSVGAVTAGPVARATGPFDNWAALAGYLLPIVLVLAALAFAGIGTRARRWFVATWVLAVVALALTAEQSAIICLLVGVVVLVRRYARDQRVMRWVLVGIAVAALILSPILISRIVNELSGSAGTGRIAWVPQTLSFRWSIWTRQYLPAIGGRPLSGYGVVAPLSVHWPYPESEYVAFLMEGGLPMLAVFGALVWAMIDGVRKASRSADPFERALGRALTIIVISMLVMDAMWPFLSNGGMPQVLWALMALTVPGGLRDGRSTAPFRGAVHVPSAARRIERPVGVGG